MIRIQGAACLKEKIKLIYNPLSDLSLALDLLCHPKHHILHQSWAENVLERLSPKEKKQLAEYEKLLDGYLNLDQHFDFLSYPFGKTETGAGCSKYINSKKNWISAFRNSDMEKIAAFIGFLWENYIFPVTAEHLASIRAQIDKGYLLLEENGLNEFFTTVNDRVTIDKNGTLKIEKRHDSNFKAEDLDVFYIELSLFAFPHLVISDCHKEKTFFLSWDVLFRNDQNIVPGIDRISSKAFALSDKSRLRILLMLSEAPMTQKELTHLMGFAKSTISRHINILLDSDLILSEDGERNVILKINRSGLENLSEEIRSWLGKP